MTVKELVAKLQAMPPDLQVVMQGKYACKPVVEIDAGVFDKDSGDFTEPECWVEPPPSNAVRLQY